MANFMTSDASEPVAAHLFGVEVDRATAEAYDLDFAFQLQMAEAMAASSGQPLPAQSIVAPVILDTDDVAFTFELQQTELQQFKQFWQDREVAEDEAKETQMELSLRLHDSSFATGLLNISDDEWEDRGDLLGAPYDPTQSAAIQCVLQFNGAARGNPGHGGAAAVLKSSDGAVLGVVKKYLGDNVTYDFAEYSALLEGLELSIACGVKRITVFGDSEAVCNQVSGHWRCQHRNLVPLLDRVQHIQSRFEQFSIQQQPRESNSHADRLANEAIDEHVAGAHSKLAQEKKKKRNKKRRKKTIQCAICLEDLPATLLDCIEACGHEFCRSCLGTYAEVRVKDKQVPILCPHPDCHQVLSRDECGRILPPASLQLLTLMETEAAIPDSEKVYCPFPDCSTLMALGIDTSRPSSSSQPPSSTIGAAECHKCFRLFCVECQVPWHSERTCEEYQALPPDMRGAEDMKLYQLAEKQKWRRCAKCGRMIELASGCYHMTCRCGYEFCYTCGAKWQGGAATCHCTLWDERNIIRDVQMGGEPEARPLRNVDNDNYYDNYDDEDDDDDYDDDYDDD